MFRLQYFSIYFVLKNLKRIHRNFVPWWQPDSQEQALWQYYHHSSQVQGQEQVTCQKRYHSWKTDNICFCSHQSNKHALLPIHNEKQNKTLINLATSSCRAVEHLQGHTNGCECPLHASGKGKRSVKVWGCHGECWGKWRPDALWRSCPHGISSHQSCPHGGGRAPGQSGFSTPEAQPQPWASPGTFMLCEGLNASCAEVSF